MKFQDMPYESISIDELQKQAEEIGRRLDEAKNYGEARDAFFEWQTVASLVATQQNLMYIRHSINTEDAFYSGEKDYWDQNGPLMQELFQGQTMRLLKNRFRPEFVNEFGSLMFRDAEIELRTFSPEIIPDLQEENKLDTEYDKILASAQIEFDGKVLTLPQLTPYKQSPDDAVRTAAWEADAAFFASKQDQLDRIFDEMVRLRDGMAKKLGYEDFVGLGYDRMTRNSYTARDVGRFRPAVKKYVVPLAKQLKEEQAARLGVAFPMALSDDVLQFRSGNARPQGDTEAILAHGGRMYREMSPETAEFIDVMFEQELMDVVSRKGKSGGGYCTSLPDYKAPFIFANFNGTQGDVEVMTHEAGHAFAAWMARDILPLENRSPTMESCEIHSMSMEFFAWDWAEGFFGKDTEKFYYGHLEGALSFLPYGTMVDEFQHIIYRRPGLTPKMRHETWLDLERSYRPWLDLSKLPFYAEGRGWQRQMHIYQNPFYYIDYCLAQTVALQFWALMRKNRKVAWRRYLALVQKAGTETFDGLVETAGLATPFGEKALGDVARAANEFLRDFDRGVLV